jgi:hypothetical protein
METTMETTGIKSAADSCGEKARKKRRFSVAQAHMRFGPSHSPLLNRTYVTAFGRRFDLGVPVDQGLDRLYSAAFGRLYDIEDIIDIPAPMREALCPRYDEVLGDMEKLKKYNTT